MDHIEATRVADGGERVPGGAPGIRIAAITRLDQNGRLTLRWGSRRKKLSPAPEVTVLLEEFAERFDRSFLPTMAVEWRP